MGIFNLILIISLISKFIVHLSFTYHNSFSFQKTFKYSKYILNIIDLGIRMSTTELQSNLFESDSGDQTK